MTYARKLVASGYWKFVDSPWSLPLSTYRVTITGARKRSAELPRYPGVSHHRKRSYSVPSSTSLPNSTSALGQGIRLASPFFLSQLPKPGHTLTRREGQILELLTQGHSRARIAERLYISLSTVKTQLRSIYRKLEVSSAAEAIAEAE